MKINQIDIASITGISALQGAIVAVAAKGVLGLFSVTLLCPTSYPAIALIGAAIFASYAFTGIFCRDMGNAAYVLAGMVTLGVGFLIQAPLITTIVLLILNIPVIILPALIYRQKIDFEYLLPVFIYQKFGLYLCQNYNNGLLSTH